MQKPKKSFGFQGFGKPRAQKSRKASWQVLAQRLGQGARARGLTPSPKKIMMKIPPKKL